MQFQACDLGFFRCYVPWRGYLGPGRGARVRGCDTRLCCVRFQSALGCQRLRHSPGARPGGCQRLRQSFFGPLFLREKPGFGAGCRRWAVVCGLGERFLGVQDWRARISTNFRAIFSVGPVARASEVATLLCVWIGPPGCCRCQGLRHCGWASGVGEALLTGLAGVFFCGIPSLGRPENKEPRAVSRGSSVKRRALGLVPPGSR